ncbi:hypothetical protein GCM10012275_36550 [Longimycelium tulufanense]|uniref:Uncharacterized protein n=1 Tax=Longimycelium tulufanense TaxID=907463 RepID=A0A8J3CG83_9PSEU|nr:hypothetical protein GCM10012275_36550 [Longimycelium tulufanense]
MLAGGGVAAVGVVVLLVVLLTGGGAESAAKDYVAMMNTRDYPGLGKATCSEQRENTGNLKRNLEPGSRPRAPESYRDIRAEVRLGEVTEQGADAAVAALSVSYVNVPEQSKTIFRDVDLRMKLVREDGEWRVCELRQGGGQVGTSPGDVGPNSGPN